MEAAEGWYQSTIGRGVRVPVEGKMGTIEGQKGTIGKNKRVPLGGTNRYHWEERKGTIKSTKGAIRRGKKAPFEVPKRNLPRRRRQEEPLEREGALVVGRRGTFRGRRLKASAKTNPEPGLPWLCCLVNLIAFKYQYFRKIVLRVAPPSRADTHCSSLRHRAISQALKT